MSLKSKIILNSLFGAIGGFVGWAVLEFLLRGFYAIPFDKHQPADIMVANTEIGLLAGLLIGGMLGAADALWTRSPKAARRALWAGCLAGAAGGFLGITIGQTAFDVLSPDPKVHTMAAFAIRVFARAIGWTIVGAGLGAAQGIPTLSGVRAKHGAIGGLVGGFISGMSFELVANILRSDVHSRIVSFSLTGLLIGFMIGLVQDLLKPAWVVILRDHNEGREIPVYKPVTTVGRDEMADVPVFADRSVLPRHALIRRENRRHAVEDVSAGLGISVNGQTVTRQTLKDRDIIELGSVKLLFREKATASRHAPSPDAPRSGPLHIPTSPNVCPFCGGVKDANGNCDCTVGAPAPATQAAAPIPSGPVQQPIVPSAARLVARSGPGAPGVFELRDPETSIGREDGRDIVLSNDSTVSRRHARVVRETSGYAIYDDGSSNGTFVNGARVTRSTLNSGDIVAIGGTEFVFQA